MSNKLDVGAVLTRVFEIYRGHAAVLLGAAAVVFVIDVLLSLLFVSIAPILILVAFAVQLVVTTFYQGMVVNLVNDVQDGRRDNSVEDLFRAVAPVALALILAGLLRGFGTVIGFILLIVPGLFLLTIWSVIAPAIVLERAGVIESFGRSRALVKGSGWPVFGVIVIVFLIVAVVSLILGLIGAALGDAGTVIADFIASTATAPIAALVAAVLYFQLRAARGEAGASDVVGGDRGQAAAPDQAPAPPGQATPAPGQAPPGQAPPAPGQAAPPESPRQ